MFLFCLVFAMFCARLFICALWSPAGKGLTSWLSFVVSSVSLSLSHWYPGSGVVLDCIDSWSLQPYLLQTETLITISNGNSGNFMQTISLYLVKISVNEVNYCTIITWCKIVIDNNFCDGQSSKGNNSKSINDRATILALCMSTHVGWYLYKVSWI